MSRFVHTFFISIFVVLFCTASYAEVLNPTWKSSIKIMSDKNGNQLDSIQILKLGDSAKQKTTSISKNLPLNLSRHLDLTSIETNNNSHTFNFVLKDGFHSLLVKIDESLSCIYVENLVKFIYDELENNMDAYFVAAYYLQKGEPVIINLQLQELDGLNLTVLLTPDGRIVNPFDPSAPVFPFVANP